MPRFLWAYVAIIAGAMMVATLASHRPEVVAFALGRGPNQPTQMASLAQPATQTFPAARQHFDLPKYAIEADRSGHYRTTVELEGREVRMLVDTGATTVALRKEDADNLGIRPAASDYTIQVSTANGMAKAAPVWLPLLRIGNIEVHDVQAMVLSAGAASDNLLGMSFLQRLRRFGVADGRMVLEQ